MEKFSDVRFHSETDLTFNKEGYCAVIRFKDLPSEEVSIENVYSYHSQNGRRLMFSIYGRGESEIFRKVFRYGGNGKITKEEITYPQKSLKPADEVLYRYDETGKLTAPTAQNKQEITLYVFTPQGAYLYDAKAHVLQPVAEGDFRADLAGPQDFAAKAPVNLVIVGDFSVFPPERNWAMTDAGYVSQNIYLFCAGNNMATVARGTMDKAKIKEVLKLRPEQEPILNHPVGYKK